MQFDVTPVPDLRYFLMLEVMLCGASDTDRVSNEFVEVARKFGAEPWHYLDGKILHLNSSNASWEANSRATVDLVNLCVFVIVERYGEVTWATEMERVLNSGKPFLLLCLSKTYQKYLTLTHSITDLSAITDQGDRNLVDKIRELESRLQVTVVQFDNGYFRDVLTREMSSLFLQTLQLVQERNIRAASLGALSGDLPRASQLAVLTRIALDELEEKVPRKQAIGALARIGGISQEDLRSLLSSAEQGVQRLATIELSRLWGSEPLDPDFAEFCVALANNSDDVGVVRRLLPALTKIDLEVALDAFHELDLSEVGTRRRLAELLQAREAELTGSSLRSKARALAHACVIDPSSGWVGRCKEFISRLERA